MTSIVATWYGTVAIHLVTHDRLGIFLDPYFSRPSDAFPHIEADPETANLDPLDAVFVSHSHFDHILNLPNLVRRYPSVHAYVPATTVENCRRLCSGATFGDYRYEMTDSDWQRVHTVTAGDTVAVSSHDGSVKLQATAIRSAHVTFDAYSIVRGFSRPKLWQRWGHYSKYLFGFPKGEVVGWDLRLTARDESRRIVFFGSLCKKYPEVLSRFTGCDYFIAPFAGRRNILPHARAMTQALRPRVVIPSHYDDFFPPVSYLTDFRNYEKWLAQAMPEVKLVRLAPEQPTVL